MESGRCNHTSVSPDGLFRSGVRGGNATPEFHGDRQRQTDPDSRSDSVNAIHSFGLRGGEGSTEAQWQ